MPISPKISFRVNDPLPSRRGSGKPLSPSGLLDDGADINFVAAAPIRDGGGVRNEGTCASRELFALPMNDTEIVSTMSNANRPIPIPYRLAGWAG
mmetsp:Transcript_5412/g.11519  ORF Transcript_5412/g.11519 Transcript_5412/m.11519 type:complete len:95 (-) Transcript_5412:226-510(-)